MIQISHNLAETTRLSLWSLLCLLGMIATGCVPLVQTEDGRSIRANSEEFQEYIESVFRRQNAVSVRLMWAIDGDESEEVLQELERIESRLLDVCRPLNDVAIARRRHRSIDFDQKRELIQAAPQCERVTAQTESALRDIGY